jgi:hypothetical protein
MLTICPNSVMVVDKVIGAFTTPQAADQFAAKYEGATAVLKGQGVARPQRR